MFKILLSLCLINIPISLLGYDDPFCFYQGILALIIIFFLPQFIISIFIYLIFGLLKYIRIKIKNLIFTYIFVFVLYLPAFGLVFKILKVFFGLDFSYKIYPYVLSFIIYFLLLIIGHKLSFKILKK